MASSIWIDSVTPYCERRWGVGGYERMVFFAIRILIAAGLALASVMNSGMAGAASIAVVDQNPNQRYPIVEVRGQIEIGDNLTFDEITGPLNDAIIVFVGPGGNLRAALAIGARISLRSFVTAVPANQICASACALAWLAGAKRFMAPSSRIGFHAASVQRDGVVAESGLGNALVGAYLTTLKLPLSAIEYIASPPPAEVKWLSFTDAMTIGINVSLLPEPKRQAKQDSSGIDDTQSEIERAVKNMDKQYKQSGITGLSSSVQSCYAQFSKNSTLKIARYCFALDHSAMRLDQEVSKLLGVPTYPYFQDHRVLTRANWAFDRMGVDQATRGQQVRIWSLASEAALISIRR